METNRGSSMTTNEIPVGTNYEVPVSTTSVEQATAANTVPTMETNGGSSAMTNGIPVGTNYEVPVSTTSVEQATAANTVPTMETNGGSSAMTNGIPVGANYEVPVSTISVEQATAANTVPTMETNGGSSMMINGIPVNANLTTSAEQVNTTNSEPTLETNRKSSMMSNGVPYMLPTGTRQEQDIAFNATYTVPATGANGLPYGTSGRGGLIGVPVVATNAVQSMVGSAVSSMATNGVLSLTVNETLDSSSHKVPTKPANAVSATNTVPTMMTIGVPTMTTNAVPCLTTNETPVLSNSMEQSASTIAINRVPTTGINGAPTMTTNTVPCLTTNEIPAIASNETPVLSSSMEQSTSTIATNTVPTIGFSRLPNYVNNSFPAISINERTSIFNPRVPPPLNTGVSTINNDVLSMTTVGKKPSWSHYASTMRVPRMQFHPYIPSLDGVTRRRTRDLIGRECPVHSSYGSSQVRSTFHQRDQNTVSTESCYRLTPSQVQQDKPGSEPEKTTNNIRLLQKQLNDAICVGNLRAKYARLLYGNQQLLENLTKPVVTHSLTQGSGYGAYPQENSTPLLPYSQSTFASNLTRDCGDEVSVQSTTLSANGHPDNGTNLHSQNALHVGHSVVSHTLGQNREQDINSQNNISLAVHFSTATNSQQDTSMQSCSMSEVFPPVQQYSNRSCLEGGEPDFCSESVASLPVGGAGPSLFTLNLLANSQQAIHSQSSTPFEVCHGTLPLTERQDQENDSQAPLLMNVHANNEMPATRNKGDTPCDFQSQLATDIQTKVSSERASRANVQQTSFQSFALQSPKQRNGQNADANNGLHVAAQASEHSILAGTLSHHSQMPVGTWSPVYNHCQLVHPYPDQAAPFALMPAYSVPLPGCAVPLSPHLSLPPNYGGAPAHSNAFGYNLQMQDSQLLPNVHAYQPVTILPRPLLSHQPYLAQDVHIAPSSDTQQQRVFPNVLAPSLQPTVNPYPNPYLMFSAANLLFIPPKTHHEEQESSTSNQQPLQVEEQSEKENNNEEQLDVQNEEEVDLQYEEEVDVQNLPSPSPSHSSSNSPSLREQRWRSRRTYIKKSKKNGGNNHKKKENKLHKCSICGKSYSRAFTLKTHYRVHTGEKPYKCPFCTKQFTQSGGLDSHLRTHTGEKPYQCGVCNREFSHSAAVKNHMRTHTGAKPFVCDLGCGKSFSDCSTLTKHRRVHTGEKPFECRECGAKFTQAGNMNKHLKKIHGIERPSGSLLLQRR